MPQDGKPDPRRLLIYFLWIVGLPALAVGGAMIALNATLPELTGFGERWNFVLIGVCLTLYGLFVIRLARAEPVDESHIRATILFNALCLLPYGFLVISIWPALTPVGMALLSLGALFLVDGVTFLWMGLRLRRDAEKARAGAGETAKP